MRNKIFILIPFVLLILSKIDAKGGRGGGGSRSGGIFRSGSGGSFRSSGNTAFRSGTAYSGNTYGRRSGIRLV